MFLFGLLGSALAACPVPVLPSSFSVTEESLTWTTTLDVSSGGTVSGDLWSWTPSFTYTDGKGVVVATGRKAAFSWGDRIDVYDCDDAFIDSIQEKMFSLFSGYETLYSVVDARGNEVATSGKFGWFDTNFAIADPAGHTVATLNRPRQLFGGDAWYGEPAGRCRSSGPCLDRSLQDRSRQTLRQRQVGTYVVDANGRMKLVKAAFKALRWTSLSPATWRQACGACYRWHGPRRPLTGPWCSKVLHGEPMPIVRWPEP